MITNIAIASDHRGVTLKRLLVAHLQQKHYQVQDFGCFSEESVDYPDFAKLVTNALVENKQQVGILICGSGIGMSIAANRNPKIRAALCHNVDCAEAARRHNNANVIVFGRDFISDSKAIKSLDTFLSTEFSGGRHQPRLDKLS